MPSNIVLMTPRQKLLAVARLAGDRKFLSFDSSLPRCSGAFSGPGAGSHESSGLLVAFFEGEDGSKINAEPWQGIAISHPRRPGR